MKLIECVPNISEGRNPAVIRQIAAAAADCGVQILGVDAGYDANRTVITFAGGPEPVFNAAFALIKKSRELIDMSKHRGAHPRLGAVDVCPFVPLSGVTLEECSAPAVRLAQKTAEELQIPVYLYEAAARSPERKNLAFIRKGEYESLPEKLKILPPDFGPAAVTSAGAITIGARNFLIAYNITLNTSDVKKADLIARAIRESGNGRKLKGVKALGWFMPEYNAAQVSCNITNFEEAGISEVFEACKEEARACEAEVNGSEIIGLVPLAALLKAGGFYSGVSDGEKIRLAVKFLGLGLHAPFNPPEKIIEYKLKFLKNI